MQSRVFYGTQCINHRQEIAYLICCRFHRYRTLRTRTVLRLALLQRGFLAFINVSFNRPGLSRVIVGELLLQTIFAPVNVRNSAPIMQSQFAVVVSGTPSSTSINALVCITYTLKVISRCFYELVLYYYEDIRFFL